MAPTSTSTLTPSNLVLESHSLLYRSSTFSPRSIPILPSLPLAVYASRQPPISTHFGVCCNRALPLSSSLSLKPMGDGYVPISAVPHDGSGEGGGGRGGGGGESGWFDDYDGKNGSNWRPLSWYWELLANFPVFTKAITAALLTLIGDLICQLAIDKMPSLDYKRTFVFTFSGFALVGPTLHFWYLYLSKLVTAPGVTGVFMRLLLDQFVFAPLFIGVFLSALVTLEGRPSQVVGKLKQEWFSSVLANWQLWIPFQFINFRFVPQQFQVLASNVVALVWNVILSFKAHKELPK